MTGSESAKILVLARNDVAFTELGLSCRCQRISLRKISFLNFYKIAKDCYQALNWNATGTEVPIRSLVVLLFKIAIKRNRLFRYKIYEIEFVPDFSCTNHTFPSQLNCWYSTSSSRLGFPWERDTFFNSLSILRGDFMDLYCFDGGNSVTSNYQINESVEMSLAKVPTDRNPIGQWKSTKFFQFESASIIHGNVLVYESLVFLKDFSLESYKFPPTMRPNSVWLNPLSAETCFTPKFNVESNLHGSYVFVDANENLYHFVAESIRVLVFALEEELDFQGIIIRDDLPKNFYELIEYIAPNKTIYKVNQGEKVSVSTIIACGFQTPESQKSGFFSRHGDADFKHSDDFISFNFIRKKFLIDFESRLISRVAKPSQFENRVVCSVRPLRSSRGFFFSGSISRVLEFIGVSIIDLNTSYFSNTVSLISDANYFFCESGAGVVNILFAKPGMKFVEIGVGDQNNWSTLASALEIHYEEVRVSSMFRILFKDYLDSNPFPLVKLLWRYLIVRPVLRNLK
jgi:hypothetical protein